MDFITREAWGALPPRDDLVYVASTEGVKIHYEGVYVPAWLAAPDAHGSSCAGHMRDLQASHLNDPDEDYSDFAYTAAVCPHGSVFEGRGAHNRTAANGSESLNTRHYSVLGMVGDSGLVEPTDAMLDGLVDAVEWLRSDGAAGGDVLGHLDGYPTLCPGDALYAWVQAGAPRPGSAEADEPAIARYQVVINGLAYGYGASGDHVTTVGEALVARGFGAHYREGPGPLWSDADTRNYSDYQLSLGYTGTAPYEDADGVPGAGSLRKLLGYLPAATTAA